MINDLCFTIFPGEALRQAGHQLKVSTISPPIDILLQWLSLETNRSKISPTAIVLFQKQTILIRSQNGLG